MLGQTTFFRQKGRQSPEKADASANGRRAASLVLMTISCLGWVAAGSRSWVDVGCLLCCETAVVLSLAESWRRCGERPDGDPDFPPALGMVSAVASVAVAGDPPTDDPASAGVSDLTATLEGSVDLLFGDLSEQMEQVAKGADEAEAIAGLVESATAQMEQACASAARAGESVMTGREAIEAAVSRIAALQAAISQSAATVDRLGSLGKEIAGILTIVKRVAEQTHLLSLNAAIESARAGRHGRGFGVVADEVRRLANESGEGTKRIAAMLADIQNATQEAAGAMRIGLGEAQDGAAWIDRLDVSLRTIAAVVDDSRQSMQAMSRLVASMSLSSTKLTDGMTSALIFAAQSVANAETVAVNARRLAAMPVRLG